MQKWFDEAADGVIYFSLGTNFRSIDLPEAKRDAILKTFAKLKQRVLWKWENDTMPGKPKNVMIKKWTSQTNVLGNSLIIILNFILIIKIYLLYFKVTRK